MSYTSYEKIYNNGERLIPGESHDLAETIRHKSSYAFFQKIIMGDISGQDGQPVRILDLGCGVGHDAFMLSGIPGAAVVAVDPSAESIEYARRNYAAANILYIHDDAANFLSRQEQFDYVVSRHALEHIDDGIGIAVRFLCTKRLMVNVPYKEPEGNIHHRVHFIDETTFQGYGNCEFFFEDLEGVTETRPEKLAFANSIVCVRTSGQLPPVTDMIQFPFAPWSPSLQERLLIEMSSTLRQLRARVDDLEQQNAEVRRQFEELKTELQEQHGRERTPSAGADENTPVADAGSNPDSAPS